MLSLLNSAINLQQFTLILAFAKLSFPTAVVRCKRNVLQLRQRDEGTTTNL